MTDKNTDEEPQGRRFRARNVLVLPQGLYTGPGATNMRLEPDQIVTLTDEAIARHGRFLNNRLRAGDLEEVVVEETVKPAARTTYPTTFRSGDDE